MLNALGKALVVMALLYLAGCAGNPPPEPEAHGTMTVPGQDQIRQREVKEWVATITSAIANAWLRPPSPDPNLKALARIRLGSTGDVQSASIIASSGVVPFDQSVLQAIYKASPLPLPSSPEVFDPVLTVCMSSTPAVCVESIPASRDSTRNLAEVQETFDRNKGPFFAIFNRRGRENPALGEGRIVFSFGIAPDGRVSHCEIVTSAFNDPEFERLVLERIMTINFGAKDAPLFEVPHYPIEFHPLHDAPQQIATTVEPIHSDGADPHGWRTTYLQALTQEVAKNVRYPPEAQGKAEQGQTTVRVRIARNGAILGVQLVKKSGFPALDAEARNVFERIVHLPPIPDDIYPEVAYFEFTLPLNFALK